jgi:hypothetical protein
MFADGRVSDTRNARFRATVVRQALEASVIRELGWMHWFLGNRICSNLVSFA